MPMSCVSHGAKARVMVDRKSSVTRVWDGFDCTASGAASGPGPWDASKISDEWFRAHFEYAADVVNHWVGGCWISQHPSSSTLAVETALRICHWCFVTGLPASMGLTCGRSTESCRIAREQLGMRRIPVALTFQTIKSGQPCIGSGGSAV